MKVYTPIYGRPSHHYLLSNDKTRGIVRPLALDTHIH